MADANHKKAEQLDQYFTRPALAKAVVEWADIQPGARVLEPSCGGGDLVLWVPKHVKRLLAMDLDPGLFARWNRDLLKEPHVEMVPGDFLKHREPRDAFDVAVMNPPYGYVGHGKTRQAADRLHVQHALRMAPEVIALVRANFLWGQERYSHVFRFARVVRVAVLVNRPSFYGPALQPGQDSARHDYAVVHLKRCVSSRLDPDPRNPNLPLETPFDRSEDDISADMPDLEFWTEDWRLEP